MSVCIQARAEVHWNGVCGWPPRACLKYVLSVVGRGALSPKYVACDVALSRLEEHPRALQFLFVLARSTS